MLHTVNNLVCGDAYLIDGQSNALAVDWGPGEHTDTSAWIRSFGANGGDVHMDGAMRCVARADTGRSAVGAWILPGDLVEEQKIPICIINGAVGGTLIEMHQRNQANSADPPTIYGRLLRRVQQARLTHGIRGVFWHQGENNQGAAGSTGGYGWETYRAVLRGPGGGLEGGLSQSSSTTTCSRSGRTRVPWAATGPATSCGTCNGLLPRLYSNMSIMSTLGIKPDGSCHFPPAGYAEMARLMSPLVERDNYGKVFDKSDHASRSEEGILYERPER